jgi:putative addiction module killer protein
VWNSQNQKSEFSKPKDVEPLTNAKTPTSEAERLNRVVLATNLWRLCKPATRVDKIAAMEVRPREIQRYVAPDGNIPYVAPDGNIPFDEWLNSLRDITAQAKIDAKLKRVALGNLGDYRSVGDGVYELKINYGPGYRIYFGQVGTTIILLLCGGDRV